jgi:putative transposase
VIVNILRPSFSQRLRSYTSRAWKPGLFCWITVGISEQTFSRWKRRFAGMGVAEWRRLRQLEEEHRKLKQLVADLTLAKHLLQEVSQKTL